MENGDWRTELPADFRERIVNEILVRHLSLPGLEALEEWEFVAKFEEASSATCQSDYLRIVSELMLAMEKRSEVLMANSLKSKAASTGSNPQDPEPSNSQANQTTTMANNGVEQGESLQAIRYKRGSLDLLDQRKLPLQTIYLNIRGSEDGWVAIRDMVVRGAPAIAIAAALSLAVEVSNLGDFTGSSNDAASFLVGKLEYLVSSRPTAVNLSDAATKLKQVIQKAAAESSEAQPVFQAYIEAAEVMLEDDIASNKAIGSFGASFIQKQLTDNKKISILTHCNTGSLATAGYGTALGVIRAVHEGGFLERAYCTETRPFNQGSRLTAFELVHEKIPATLIADSAAAALMNAGRVNAVIVGADRVAANGDTANKIGTYSLALSAKHHGIPFYVAAPLTSIDLSTSSGQEIVIEERSAKELLNAGGGMGEQVAASGISVWNPAFDVTPASIISGIVTEKGVITKDGTDYFDIKSFIQRVAGNP